VVDSSFDGTALTGLVAGRGLVFRRLLEQTVVTGSVTEAQVLHGYDW
jgi:hypothetical protein